MPEFVCYNRVQGFFFTKAKNIEQLDELSIGSFDVLDSVDDFDPVILKRIIELMEGNGGK